jgi:hypothetical protein
MISQKSVLQRVIEIHPRNNSPRVVRPRLIHYPGPHVKGSIKSVSARNLGYEYRPERSSSPRRMDSESFSLTDRNWLGHRMLRWWIRRNGAAGVPSIVCYIDVAVAPATHTCPIVPRGLRRGVLDLVNAIMALGYGIAHRGAGVPGAAVITRLSAVN